MTLQNQNDFTKSELYLSRIAWKVNVTRRLNDKMDYGLKEMNDTMTKAEVYDFEWWCHDGTQVLWNQQLNREIIKILIYNQSFLFGISDIDHLELSVLHSLQL